MATIARLIIAMGADPAGLRRGLNQGVNEIRQFARSAAQISGTSKIFGDLNTPAKIAAEGAVKILRDTLATRLAAAKENLAKGFINPGQFHAAAQAAAVEFNTGLRRELDQLGERKDFTNRIHAGLVSQFLNIGDDSGQAFAKGFQRATTLTRSLGLATRRIGTELTAAISVPLLGIGAAAIHFSNDFNKAMANVQSLIPGTGNRILELRDNVLALSKETGQRPNELAQGLYQLVSAFGDSADAAKILNINARAAVGGVSTVADAIAVTSAVTKAYGDTSAAAVQKVADLALLAVRLGKTTFPELAQAIGRATPLASALGVSMEELFATMATGSGVTGDVSEVSTQLRGIFQALQSPTTTMSALYRQLGVDSGDAAVKQRGFINVVRAIVQSAAASNRPLQDYISQIEGQTLALQLAGKSSESYNQKLTAMQHATGTTAVAFQALTEGINAPGHALEVVARQFEEIGIRLGTALGPSLLKAIPAITSVVGVLADLVTSFANLPQSAQETIITMAALAIAFGPVLHVMGTVITTIAAVARTFFLARAAGITFAGVMAVISSPVLAIVLAIGAVIGLLVLFRKEITHADEAIDRWVSGTLANLARKIPVIGDAIANFLQFLAGPKAVKASHDAALKLSQEYAKTVADQFKKVNPLQGTNTTHLDILPSQLIARASQRLGPPKPIVLIDPKELNAQVQTAVDRLNLAREAGQSIAAPFRDLVQLQGQINQRLQQGKLTIDDENQLTRALLNTRKALSDASGTSIEAIGARVGIAVEQLNLAREAGGDLAAPMRAVQEAIDVVNQRLSHGVLSLQDQNKLTRDLLSATKALSEARAPDTRAFDSFAAGARGALAQLQALKAAAQTDLQTPTSDTGERVNRLIQQQFLLNGAGREYERQLVQVRTAYANILGVINSTINPTKEQLDLARQLGTALEEAARASVLRATPVAAQNLLSQLLLAANSYADATVALQVARDANDKAGVKTEGKVLQGLRDQANALRAQIAKLVQSGALTPAAGEAVLTRMHDLLQSMGIDFSGINHQTAHWILKLDDAAKKVGRVLQGITGILDGLGLMDDKTRKVTQGLTTMAENIGKALSGDVSSIIATVGGLVQTIGGIFGGGKSPEEKERDRITALNTQAIRDLSRNINSLQLNVSGNKFGQLREAFNTNISDQFLATHRQDQGDDVARQLTHLGLSMKDVKDVAEQLGLTFQNTEQFYKQFRDALNATEFTRFSDTFVGQMDKLNRSFEILGITDPATKLQRTIDVLTDPKVGSPAIRDALKGIDIHTAEGLKQFQQRIADLFGNFQNLSPEQLGGLSPSEFLDALATAAGLSRDALDALTGTANDATKAMLQVPQGFKLAAAEFAAQIAELPKPNLPPPGPSSGSGLVPTPPNLAPNIDPRGMGGGATLDALLTALSEGKLGSSDTYHVQIVITGERKDATQVATETRRELQRQAKAKTGRSQDWTSVRGRI